MKFKLFIGLLCVFLGAFSLWGLNVALGVFLVALGGCAFVDAFTVKANRKYQLTAIEGTFRATVEGCDRKEAERELAHLMKSWQNNIP